MLSIQNNGSWEKISVKINNQAYQIKEGDDTLRKTIYLMVKMMESVYFRLFDLVTQSKYDDVKKSKMKTELKRITIGTVEKCLVAMQPVAIDKRLDEIGKFFTEEEQHFHKKIINYANYAIEEEDMKPYFIDGAIELAGLEFMKLKRRLELNDFDFTRRPHS